MDDLVPFLKYPANPPAVGHEETITDRSGLYLLMMVLSVLLALAAVLLGQRLAPRFGTWNATLLAGAGFVVATGVVMAVLPSLTDPSGRIVFPGFDADLLHEFRLYSVLAQAILWGALGLLLGPLVERVPATGAPSGERVPTGQPVDVG